MTTQLHPYQRALIDKISSMQNDAIMLHVPGRSQFKTFAPYLQQAGRALRGRLVHAQRARKLRQRGEVVRFAGRTSTGKAMYRWSKTPPRVIDFKTSGASADQYNDQAEAYAWCLGTPVRIDGR